MVIKKRQIFAALQDGADGGTKAGRTTGRTAGRTAGRRRSVPEIAGLGRAILARRGGRMFAPLFFFV